MYRDGAVFVAGSAHLDVLAKITGDEVAIDKIGHVVIEIGGAACNIATNLAALGLKPRLLTAMQQDSPYSGIITANLRANGVDVRVVHHDSMQAAVFSAHIGLDGEMLSAVSSMPVETAIFQEDVVREAMTGARCAILECNLSGVVLNQLAQIAHELSIPVFIASVSEEKSLRVMDIHYPLAAVFMNRRESSYFGRRVAASTQLPVIADRIGCALVVSRDKDGVTVVQEGDEIHVPPSALPENVHTLGAGDALLAATVAHHIFGEMGIADGVKKAVSFAASIIGKPNCNAGQGHAIEEALISLDRMATRDVMTGLINRRAGEKILSNAHEKALLTSALYSVLMVDIDHFKRVNDAYGHDIGDETIKTVADVLSSTVRGIDAACRWGGEEFLCILQGADINTAAAVAERIRTTVELAEIPVVGKVTVSIGVATWCATAPDAAHLVKAADQGLYEAKQKGRNRVVVADVKCAGVNLAEVALG
jgi:diguanylate cyclase (GGDEF)-like protein